jgi:hypothetical protein
MPSSFPLTSTSENQRLELEHGWEFLADPSGRLQLHDLQNVDGWRPARVGLSWHVQFEDLRDYLGAAWYRARFDVPIFPGTRHVLLKFGAVDYFCEVYLNGTPIGKHEGGYTPFSFDVAGAIRNGENELQVRVIDPPMDEQLNQSQFPEMMYNEIPHGKQNWYVQNGGIWQGVRLEFCPAIYIDRVDVAPHRNGEFRADVRLAGSGLVEGQGGTANDAGLQVVIRDSTGRAVFQTEQPLGAGNIVSITGTISSPHLWGPDDPALYALDASIVGSVFYRRRVRFGFRSFEARAGKLWLNGKPFYMMAALDQDFYPETIHSPASIQVVRDMMLKAKSLGINLLRCHLKVAHPVYLDVADELGMLVWAELPSWSDCWFPCNHFSRKAALRGEQMFEEVLARDWNHVCIVAQTVMNESWGINLEDAEQRKWLVSTFDRMKSMSAPLGRLLIDNSACEGNFHLKTDIEDFHQYYSMPDQRAQWDRWLAAFAARPAWTFSPHGDAERSGDEPLVVSEFGNWGLPQLPDELPWWFHRNFGDREATRPSGVLERFRDFGLDRIFQDYNELAREAQWHQFVSLKYEIESLRMQPSIQGYVVTAMTDVHWEANGLLDMWRNPKEYGEELRTLQQLDLVLCRLPRLNYSAGELVEADVFISHYSRRSLEGAHVRWSTESGAAGSLIVPRPVEAGSVAHVGKLSFTVPESDAPQAEWLMLDVLLPNGTRATGNRYELFFFPRPEPAELPLSLHNPNDTEPVPELELTRRGYSLGESPRATLIANTMDASLIQRVRGGAPAIVLVNDTSALPEDLGMTVKLRAGSEFDGRWFSNLNWIRPDTPPFQKNQFSRFLGFESEHVAAHHVIRGIAAADFGDVLCGITYGWLNLNSALMLQAQVGAGKLLITTLRFDAYGSDPYATRLLDEMIGYVSSKECAPRLTLLSAVSAPQ